MHTLEPPDCVGPIPPSVGLCFVPDSTKLACPLFQCWACLTATADTAFPRKTVSHPWVGECSERFLGTVKVGCAHAVDCGSTQDHQPRNGRLRETRAAILEVSLLE